MLFYIVCLSSVLLSRAYVIEPYNAWVSSSGESSTTSSESFAIAEVGTEPHNTLCYGCHKHHGEAKITISEVDLTALRIEYIKQQILKKLRLKEPPKGLMPLSELPKPLEEGDAILMRSHDHRADVDDFFAKTTQAVLFPFDVTEGCDVNGRTPAACFSLQLATDMEFQNIRSAELWLYKRKDVFDSHNQTFVISEVAHWDTKHSFPRVKPIAILETDVEEGWIRVDVAASVREWLQYGEHNHSINVACTTCGMDVTESPISHQSEHKLFLVISTYFHKPPSVSQLPAQRVRRHTNCMPGTKECCRENLYVSFKDVGWDDWIIFPTGYNAYFCRGSCTSAAAVTLSGSHYNAVIRKLLYQGVSETLRLELLPCCTATQFLPLQLLYMDNNNTITQKTLPNMIVESCGCL